MLPISNRIRFPGSFASFWITILAFSHLSQDAEASGLFQVEVLSIKEIAAVSSTLTAPCCAKLNSQGPLANSSTSCSRLCRPYVTLCLKQYQRHVNLKNDSGCLYGIRTSQIVDLPFPASPESGYKSQPIRLQTPFQISWMKSFTLVLKLWNAVGEKPNNSTDALIESVVVSSEITSTEGWRSEQHEAKFGANMGLRYRVLCNENHGGATCHNYCKARDDQFGHWTCSANLEKICLDGWTGANCDKAICAPGCQNGTCQRPGECSCPPGWAGEKCDQCLTHPGCKNGKCVSKPGECICDMGWGGPLCDLDLDICASNNPCSNHAVCYNLPGGQYECRCPPGYGGPDCSKAMDPCAESQCASGGLCFPLNGTAQCRCLNGWTGRFCDINVNECDPNPCMNGGTCEDETGYYRCSCPNGFVGMNCEERDMPVIKHDPETVMDELITHLVKPSGNNASVTENVGGQVEHLGSGDSSSVVITVIVATILVLFILLLVLLAFCWYRRRIAKRRENQTRIVTSKYSVAANNQKCTKDLIQKDVGESIRKQNMENEARLKILNNVFVQETKIVVDDSMSEKSSSLEHGSNYSKQNGRMNGDLRHGLVNELSSVDLSKDNRERSEAMKSRNDSKNYMDSSRSGSKSPDPRLNRTVPSSIPAALIGDGKSREDYTVV